MTLNQEAKIVDRSIQQRAQQVLQLTLVSLALAAAVGPVGAQSPQKSMQKAAPEKMQAEKSSTDKATAEAAFTRADADKDGRLSKAEAANLPAIASRFDELDKDKDGNLSLDEFMGAFSGGK